MDLHQKWHPEIPDAEPKVIIQPEMPPLSFQAREAINVLRGNLQLSGPDLKTIAVTSAQAHEGKSSVAFRLAHSLAGLEKRTLYLDCDIRNSMTITRYHIMDPVVGLSEFLCGRSTMEDVLYQTEDPYLDLLFTGAIAPNPSELISSRLFTMLLEQLRRRYDYVILDTPPVNLVIDGVLISKVCDGTVLVVESGRTERNQAMRAKRQLEYADVRLLGAVLNKAGDRKDKYGHYGYSYGYGYGYGEEKHVKALKSKHSKHKG